MATPIFGITAADIQRKIAPASTADFTFRVGGTGADLSSDDAEAIALIAEDTVVSRIPARYRGLLRRVEQEIVTNFATVDQTQFATGLAPISNLKLYRNYDYHHRSWAARRPEDVVPAGDYSVTLSTGAIVFAAPWHAGETLLAEYDHAAAAQCRMLRDAAVTLAAVEVARQFAFFRTSEGFERFESWESTTYANLNRVDAIELFDRLHLGRATAGNEDFYRAIRNLS